MIVFQTNAANQGQNQSGNQTQEDFCRCPVLATCVVAALIISLVQYILTAIFYPFGYYWIALLHTVVFCLDFIAIVISGDTYTYASIHQFCWFWTIVLIFQIVHVVSYIWIFWNPDAVTLVLTWVKFALFVVILILSIILYRKRQRNNNNIRYSNFEPVSFDSEVYVATNINNRGQVAIVGRRPQNQDYLAQLSVISENVYNDSPPRYEDLDQPPTYEESLQLQQQE